MKKEINRKIRELKEEVKEANEYEEIFQKKREKDKHIFVYGQKCVLLGWLEWLEKLKKQYKKGVRGNEKRKGI